MKPFPSFVMWDQDGLQFQVRHYHGLDPVRHWVQLKGEHVIYGTISVTHLLHFHHGKHPARQILRYVHVIYAETLVTTDM